MVKILVFLLVYCSLSSFCLASEKVTRKLSLQESILLVVRKNPNVQVGRLNQVLQKFAVEVQEWEFSPHFVFEAKHTTTRTYSVTTDEQVTSNTSGYQPTATWLSPIGTKVTAASVNNVTDHYNPGLSLQVIQPLMRGFGRPIVEAELYNALDSEKISRLNLQGELQNTITAVINAYLDVVLATKNLELDQEALSRADLSLSQTQKFIKAGYKAGVELVTVKAGIANLRTHIASDINTVVQSRYALLTSIGLDPDTNVDFSDIDIDKLIGQYHIPTLPESKNLILDNDIQYQIAQIILEGATKRAILVAQDNTRWQLDLTLDASSGNSTGGGRNAGVNSLVNGINRTNSATLDLIIPIDDRAAKNQIASTVIALRQSKIALRQQKWSIQTNVITGWKNILSAERVLRYAKDAENLQLQSYKVSAKKYAFGFIDSLELQTAQMDLIASERELVSNRINYLKALVALDSLTGMTLKTWGVSVNYA